MSGYKNRKFFVLLILIITLIVFNIIQLVVANRKAEISKVKNISDQNELADIAKNYKKVYIRKIALNNLDSIIWQNLFINLVKNDKEWGVRSAAIINRNFTDQSELNYIKENDSHRLVREHAAKSYRKKGLYFRANKRLYG